MSVSSMRNMNNVMTLEERRQELIAKNLSANGLAGYKKEVLAINANQETGKVSGYKSVDFDQGGLKRTNRSLDVAISGDAFFEVKSPDGKTYYTRNGSFILDTDRKLLTSDGFSIQASGADQATRGLQLNPGDDVNNLTLTSDGTFNIIDGITGLSREVGKLKLVTFKKNDKLERRSASYFSNNSSDNIQSNKEATFKVINNMLETSNGTPVKEMVSMVQSMREFEMGQKIMNMLSDQFKMEQQKLTK